MLIAQLTDTHIKRPGEKAYGRIDTAAYLTAAIAHLNALVPRPDVVLFTGDLTDHGTPEQMDHISGYLRGLEIPLLPIPGNHDDRTTFHQTFPAVAATRSPAAFSYVADRGPLRFVMLDSSVPGEPFGRLDGDSLELLEAALSGAPARPALIAVHHPPVEVGIAHMDRQNLRNAAALARIVADAPNVLAILCGHVHRTIHAGFAGAPVIVAPSPAHAVALDLDPAAPPAFRMEPPAILLHRWEPAPAPYGRLVTHTSFIGDYGCRHPFYDANGGLL